jgi:hypothetical protein
MKGRTDAQASQAASAAKQGLARVFGSCHLSQKAVTCMLQILTAAGVAGLPKTFTQFTVDSGYSGFFEARAAVQAYCPRCGVRHTTPQSESLQSYAAAAGVSAPFDVLCNNAECGGKVFDVFSCGGGQRLGVQPNSYDFFFHPEPQITDMMQKPAFWRSYKQQFAAVGSRRTEWAAGGKMTTYVDWMNGHARDWFEEYGKVSLSCCSAGWTRL